MNNFRRIWAPKTVARKATAIRQFGRFIGTPLLEGYNSPTPARAVPHPLPDGLDGIVAMIEAASNPKQEALVALCGLVGLRVGEAREIMPRHFKFVDGDIELTVPGKGDKERVVPVSKTAWLHVAPAYAEAAGHSVPLVPYSDKHARRILTALGRRAGVSRAVSSHDLRATFATAAYNKTLDLRVVQELMGHASSKTTEVYTGVSMKKMREASELV